jgi:hypothetical protein
MPNDMMNAQQGFTPANSAHYVSGYETEEKCDLPDPVTRLHCYLSSSGTGTVTSVILPVFCIYQK